MVQNITVLKRQNEKKLIIPALAADLCTFFSVCSIANAASQSHRTINFYHRIAAGGATGADLEPADIPGNGVNRNRFAENRHGSI